MSINVNFIEGRRGSVCNNNAYAVVDSGKLLAIFPASTLKEKGLTTADLSRAFAAAAEKTDRSKSEAAQRRQQEAIARRLLKL